MALILFIKTFKQELDTIGKRPDYTNFSKKEILTLSLGFDISQIPHNQITNYVKKAVAGIEVTVKCIFNRPLRRSNAS